MNFYTYIYVGEGALAYYVGEGTRRRFLDAHRVPTPPTNHILIFPHSTKQAAQQHEMFLIRQFGRLDLGTGTLLNQTDGGPGTKNCPQARGAGQRNVKSGWIQELGRSGIGGLIGGRSNAASRQIEQIATAEGRRKGGLIGGIAAMHVRWHVKRGQVRPNCVLCQPEVVNV